jgi:hypothetical protein
MRKSLGMSSSGVDFDRFMKAIVAVPKAKMERKKVKRRKVAAEAGRGLTYARGI